MRSPLLPRFPMLSLQALRAEPWMVAMAAVAVGMFIGYWVIGPAISHSDSAQPAWARPERVTFEAMVARPDPSPYRTPTPAFEAPGNPNYATIARAKARAETSGQRTPGGESFGGGLFATPSDDSSEPSQTFVNGRVVSRPAPDRHTASPF